MAQGRNTNYPVMSSNIGMSDSQEWGGGIYNKKYRQKLKLQYFSKNKKKGYILNKCNLIIMS